MELKHELQMLLDRPMNNEMFKIDEIMREMLLNIGNIDSELRDELIYSTFAMLISNDLLTSDQMINILKDCLSEDYLFYQIGEKNTDSVFKRSFSALVITELLKKDQDTCLLPKSIVVKAIDSSISYLLEENDTRGYVDGKGWAHSIAHGADMLVVAIEHPYFQFENVNKCLNLIKVCLFKETNYVCNEDERLMFAIEALLNNKMIDSNKLEEWIIELNNVLIAFYQKKGRSIKFYKCKNNILNFLKVIYFRIEYTKENQKLREIINETIRNWHKNMYQTA